jgi:cytochrome P450
VSELSQAAAFAAGLYRNRLATCYSGYIARDPVALLRLRPGRVDSYSTYEGIRRRGVLSQTRDGSWITPSHRVCAAVLHDRRFGTRSPDVRPEDDGFDLSFLGLYPPDHTRLRKIAQPSFSPRLVEGCRPGIEQTVDRLIDRAAAAGSFDLVAALGDAPDPRELMSMCFLLLFAGFETTVNLIGNCALALLDRPALWSDLCGDPAGLAPKMVDETLRFDPPVQRTERFALEDLELEGRPVRRGQMVITLIGAANRDPEAYARPDQFDPFRSGEPDHLAFSAGIHYCLGQPLARLEAEIAVGRLAERLPGLARAGAVRRRNATTIRGPIRIPATAGTPRPVGPVAAG